MHHSGTGWLVGIPVRLAGVVIIAALPLMIALAAYEHRRQQAIVADVGVRADRIANWVAGQVDGLLKGGEDLLKAIASFPSVRDGDLAECQRVLTTMLSSFARYTTFAVADHSGTVVCSAPATAGPLRVADRAWFRRAAASDGMAIGDMANGLVTGRPTLHLGLASGPRLGGAAVVAMLGLDIAYLREFLRHMPVPTDAVVAVLDAQGNTVAQNAAGAGIDGDLAARLREAAAGPGGGARIVRGGNGRSLFLAVARSSDAHPGGLTYAVAFDVAAVRVVGPANLPMILAALASLVLLISATTILAAKAWIVGPLRRLRRAARAVADGDLTARVGPPYPAGELGEFSSAFDEMASTLREQLQRLAREQHEKAEMFRQIGDVVYRLGATADLDVTFISERARKLFDVDPAELLGPRDRWPGIKIVEPEPEKVFSAMAVARAAGHSFDLTYRIGTPAGNLRWVWDRATPLRDTDGRSVGYQGAISDMTDRRRADQLTLQQYQGMAANYELVIRAIAELGGDRDPYTAGHQRRVASLSTAIARELGLPPSRTEGLRLAAEVHDIGKIGVPSDILTKAGKLTAHELALVQRHSTVAYDALKRISFPWPLAQIIVQHHERLDGSGYPAGLKGDQILMEARILAVADVVESMLSHRPYRAALPRDAVQTELKKGRAMIYDGEVADVMLRFLDQDRLHMDDDPLDRLALELGVDTRS